MFYLVRYYFDVVLAIAPAPSRHTLNSLMDTTGEEARRLHLANLLSLPLPHLIPSYAGLVTGLSME